MKNPEYKIGDYVEFKTHFGIKRGFLQLETYPNYYRIVTRSNKFYYFYGDQIIRKLPILRDKNGRFVKRKVTDALIEDSKYWKDELNKRMDEALLEPFRMQLDIVNIFPFVLNQRQMKTLYKAVDNGAEDDFIDHLKKNGKDCKCSKCFDPKETKNDCSCYNCPKCEAEVTQQYEAERKPYDEFGSRPETIDTIKLPKNWDITSGEPTKFKEKKPSVRIMEILSAMPLTHSGYITSNRDFVALVNYLDEQFEKGKK